MNRHHYLIRSVGVFAVCAIASYVGVSVALAVHSGDQD